MAGELHKLPKAYLIPRILLWHLQTPKVRSGTGSHPSFRHGIGGGIAQVRELLPGEEETAIYSPELSGQFGGQWGIFFHRMQEVHVAIILDCTGSLDFGTPTKRHVGARIAATLGLGAILVPNEGSVSFCAIGKRRYFSGALSTRALIGGALHALVKTPPRRDHGTGLSDTLQFFLNEMRRENLIVVVSDFFINPDDSAHEWKKFARIAGEAFHEGNEIIFIRVLDSREVELKGTGSVAIASPDGGNTWSNKRTNERLEKVNKLIRQKLLAITGESRLSPDRWTRYIEIINSEPPSTIKEKLTKFLKHRARVARTHMGALT